MARPPTCRSPRRNPLFTGKYGLDGAALTEGNGTLTPISVLSCASTLALATTPAVAPSSDNKLFKQFIKAYLEAQVPSRTEVDPKPREQPLKAQFLNFYYCNLHMDCYQFCQQCENHFKIAGAKKPNKILFAALFLYGSVTQQWHQHKRRRNKAVPMTWPEFKKFLQKNLSDSRTFVDSVWKKVKCDFQYHNKLI